MLTYSGRRHFFECPKQEISLPSPRSTADVAQNGDGKRGGGGGGKVGGPTREGAVLLENGNDDDENSPPIQDKDRMEVFAVRQKMGTFQIMSTFMTWIFQLVHVLVLWVVWTVC